MIFFLFCIFVFPQQITEESVVINIEVPVRIFDRDEFFLKLQEISIYFLKSVNIRQSWEMP